MMATRGISPTLKPFLLQDVGALWGKGLGKNTRSDRWLQKGHFKSVEIRPDTG